jgi:hypothetical protein
VTGKRLVCLQKPGEAAKVVSMDYREWHLPKCNYRKGPEGYPAPLRRHARASYKQRRKTASLMTLMQVVDVFENYLSKDKVFSSCIGKAIEI